MANGNITNSASGNSNVDGYLQTSYPIRSEGQCLSPDQVTSVKGVTDQYLCAAARNMDNIIMACEAAIPNCGEEVLSMVDEGGNEINTLPKSVNDLKVAAQNLKLKLLTLKNNVDTFADQARTKDLNALTKWRKSDEYKATQNTSGKKL